MTRKRQQTLCKKFRKNDNGLIGSGRSHLSLKQVKAIVFRRRDEGKINTGSFRFLSPRLWKSPNPNRSSSMFNSSNNNHSVSISVPDDDSDELSRVRARVRKKRRKPPSRHGNGGELARWVVRKLMRNWMLLIFLPAACLLLFEVSRLGGKSNSVVKPQIGDSRVVPDPKPRSADNLTLYTKSEGNLNRLDPTTHVVHGVRERKSTFWFWVCILCWFFEILS